MIFVRSLIYQVFLIVSTVFFSSVIFVAGSLRASSITARLARSWGRSNLLALKWICGLDCHPIGLEHLPVDKAIVLAKHQSAWEIIALRALLPLDQSWVLKQELMRLPLFGAALSKLHPIAIDRAAGRKAIAHLVREGEKALREDRWVVVFPEGTRVAPGTHQPYGLGGALLAERSGVSVVPIAHNAGQFWGRRSFLKFPGTIELVVGPVVRTTGRKAAEINAEVEEWIESTCNNLPISSGSAELATM
jgi:1-acyl-sn-glycerol-3-phosphate acyltransferase